MFEKTKSITIQGGYFEHPTTLELFKDKHCLSIVYGRNGSGKSTIAKAFRQFVNKDTESQIEEGYVSYSLSTDAEIPDNKKPSVFIFDEEFVRENVRLKGKGLETIVMMGEQVELEELIEQKKSVLIKFEEELEKLTKKQEKYDNEKENISPRFYFNKIRDALRVDGGWADIDRDLKGNTIKSRITEDVINKLLVLDEPDENYDVLHNRVLSNLNLFRESKNAQELSWLKANVTVPSELDNLATLLVKPLDRPKLTDREKRLLSLLVQHTQYSTDATKQLLAEDFPFCPLCLREITVLDKKSIAQTLTHILNEEANNYEVLLNTELITFAPIEITFPQFGGTLNEHELKEAQIALINLNKMLSEIRLKINQRKSDIYTPLVSPFSEEDFVVYKETVISWAKALDTLEECVKRFNISVNKRAQLYQQIRVENDMLARKLYSDLILGYKLSRKNSSTNKKNLDSKKEECEKVRREIKELKAQAESVNIALDYINDGLKYVFYSNNKAKLIAEDGCYKLKINGKNVPPRKISVGERNVLGLCYFFARLFSNKKKDERYNAEMLIIIDDPVSSFDYGNRLGVLSLLRHQFSQISRGNTNSRILVLTHDLRSAFDLVKVRSELNNGQSTRDNFLELSNKQIKNRRISNEYRNLLEFVYIYAKNSSKEDDDHIEASIGNVMRRVIEAFSSFCYNMSFEKMMCYEGVLKSIPKEKRTYYENFMSRLALNGESHMKEPVYELNHITPYLTKEEKVQTAKSLLLFLKYVNEEHLTCYLTSTKVNDEDRISEINKWMKDESVWINNDGYDY